PELTVFLSEEDAAFRDDPCNEAGADDHVRKPEYQREERHFGIPGEFPRHAPGEQAPCHLGGVHPSAFRTQRRGTGSRNLRSTGATASARLTHESQTIYLFCAGCCGLSIGPARTADCSLMTANHGSPRSRSIAACNAAALGL